MKYRVLITKKAFQDIEQSFHWLAARSPEAAERWKERLFEVVNSLEYLPERCQWSPESRAFGTELRELRLGKRQGAYRIIFRIRRNTVQVLRVWHAARRGLDEE